MQEAARLARQGAQPLVLKGGPSVAREYCDVVLLPREEPCNGHPAWSSADGKVHLYKGDDGKGWCKWAISNKITPSSNTCFANIAAEGLLPPGGEALWEGCNDFYVQGGGTWEATPCTLLLGDAAAAVRPPPLPRAALPEGPRAAATAGQWP